MKFTVKCPKCGGWGGQEIQDRKTREWSPLWICKPCNGTGRVSLWKWMKDNKDTVWLVIVVVLVITGMFLAS